MLLIPGGALELAAAGGLGERGEGDLGVMVCRGEEEAGGLEPEVTEESSQGERGKRLNHWLVFSVIILESWSS